MRRWKIRAFRTGPVLVSRHLDAIIIMQWQGVWCGFLSPSSHRSIKNLPPEFPAGRSEKRKNGNFMVTVFSLHLSLALAYCHSPMAMYYQKLPPRFRRPMVRLCWCPRRGADVMLQKIFRSIQPVQSSPFCVMFYSLFATVRNNGEENKNNSGSPKQPLSGPLLALTNCVSPSSANIVFTLGLNYIENATSKKVDGKG